METFLLVGNGGLVLIYVIGHDSRGWISRRRSLAFLQTQDFHRVIFTRGPMEGTPTLDQARIQYPDAPGHRRLAAMDQRQERPSIPGTTPARRLTAARNPFQMLPLWSIYQRSKSRRP